MSQNTKYVLVVVGMAVAAVVAVLVAAWIRG